MQAEVRIERYADQGRCVAHIDGRVVFVRFALPDELVRVELDEPHDRDDRFWTGEVVEVLEPFGAFLFGEVVRAQPALLDEVIDDLMLPPLADGGHLVQAQLPGQDGAGEPRPGQEGHLARAVADRLGAGVEEIGRAHV